jgi:branched-chain amino acid transport system permease protein
MPGIGMHKQENEGVLPTSLRVALPSLAILAVVLIGFFCDTYVQYILSLALIASVSGAALVLLVGLARVIMLASGAMTAIGAYSSTLLIEHFSFPYLIAVAMGGLLGAVGGLVLAIPAVRFRGHNLAMVTLVFQAIAVICIRELPFTGGSAGLHVLPVKIFGHELAADYEYLLLIGVCAAALVLIITVLEQGRFGKALKAISATEIGTEAYGIHANAYRVATFAITSGCLAVAGGLLAPRLRIIDPESFGVLASVNALAYPIVGGMTSAWGGILGGGVLSILPEVLRPLAEYKAFIFAVLVLAVMIFFPGGMLAMLSRISGAVRKSLPHGGSGSSTQARTRAHAAPVLSNWNKAAATEAKVAPRAALNIADVAVSFGSLKAVKNVTLEVREGTIHGLIGPNGAGKTSLFNVVSGFLTPDSGSIRFFLGRPEKGAARTYVGKGVTRTFQHVAIYGTLTCLDNVILGIGKNSVPRSILASFRDPFRDPARISERGAAAEALALVGLSSKENELASTLSLGDQRRLEIARAVVSRPRLLLLDEPMSGVSLEEERQLLALLKKLNSEFGLTMFLIEHNIRFVLEACDRLSVMSAGEIVAEGEPRDVIANPQVRRIYFGIGDTDMPSAEAGAQLASGSEGR